MIKVKSLEFKLYNLNAAVGNGNLININQPHFEDKDELQNKPGATSI